MEVLRIDEARKRFGTVVALQRRLARAARGRAPRPARAERGRQDDAGARDRGPRAARRRASSRCWAVRCSRRAPRPELGVVPQEIAVYPLLSARENLEVFGRLHGLAGDALAARVGWALAWTGLEARDREPVQRFSGGMRRRLNIACGVLHEPRLLLLDEPTVGVDPQSRERIYEMLAVLRAGAAPRCC